MTDIVKGSSPLSLSRTLRVNGRFLVIPGGSGDDAFIKNTKMLEYVRQAAENAKDVLTVSTGSRTLGATGLLDGKRATTKKTEISKVTTAYPGVKWIDNERWVSDGKYWTASGSTAGLDMGYAYITARYSAKAAENIATNTEYVPHKDPLKDPFAVTSPAPVPGSSAPSPIPSATPAPPSAAPPPSATSAPPSTTQAPGATPAPATKGNYVYAGPV